MIQRLFWMALLVSTGHGFAPVSQVHSTPFITTKEHLSSRLDTRLSVFPLDALDSFFQTEPYAAAFLTCSLKASAADWVAQSQQQEHNVRRNLAFILYGGFYQGCVQTFIFSVLFPAWFPDPSFTSVMTQVAIDLLILGPMVCMPTVYTMKALLAGEESLTAGIDKYVDHVQTKGILFKYWSIWLPAQTINFAMVPPHLRVVFVACVSFFWICLLSTVSSSETEAQSNQEQYLPQPLPVPVFAESFLAAQQRAATEQRDHSLARVTSS